MLLAVSDADFLVLSAAAAFALVILFVLIRELCCWYWKINHMARLLAGLASRLDTANALLMRLADAADQANKHVRSLKLKPPAAGPLAAQPGQRRHTGSAEPVPALRPAVRADTPAVALTTSPDHRQPSAQTPKPVRNTGSTGL
jgi:hypothetical protein